MTGKRIYLLTLVLLGAAAFPLYGPVVTCVALGTTGCIAFVEVGEKRHLAFFGHISYSLYLLHVPVGGHIINLSMRHVTSLPGKLTAIAVALSASVGAAWLLHRWVERRALRSRRFHRKSETFSARGGGSSCISFIGSGQRRSF